MQTIDGRPVYAATDLVAYLACEHLTQLERAALAGLVKRPERDDPELDIIRRRGLEHEERYLAELESDGRRVVRIEREEHEDRGTELRRAAQATIDAMAGGADVIYQATFFDGTWLGFADFLLRRDDPERPSRWGPYQYEVADTKLARHVKASAILQICSYIAALEPIQGVRPEWFHVVLGGSAHATERLRVDDFMAYYRAARDRFATTMSDATPPSYPPIGTYPEPVEHCDVCRWAAECATRRRRDDHLSLVAGITGRQRRALEDRGVTTLEGLGDLVLPMVPPLEGIDPGALERTHAQAAIQLLGRREDRRIHELLLPPTGMPLDPERGLAILPPPSRGDLFFDIEGDPYAFDDGIDYLFGVRDADGTFTAFWSRDERGEFSLAGERAAFERLMAFFAERLAADPSLHIYHYAPYEPTALKRLMGRHGVCEDQVDGLLRGGILVDLFRAVRQGLRASVESYSIKKLEPFYGFTRQIDLRDAGSSIVAFETWLQLGDGERPDSGELDRIERYNEDDVVSNQRLRDWLEGLRGGLAALTGQDVPRPGPRTPDLPADDTEARARTETLVARLTDPARVPVDPAERTPEQSATWLLAQLIGWHRREEKVAWWDFHRRMDETADQLVEDDGAIGLLEPEGRISTTSKGLEVWRYRFPDQEIDLGRGTLHDPARKAAAPGARPGEWATGELVALDQVHRTVVIKRKSGTDHPRAVVPLEVIQTKHQREALFELGQWVAEHGIDADGPVRAARDLLLRRPPRAGQAAGEALVRADEPDLDAARRLGLALDHGVLAIQGPPGSGKTWSGARMILALLRAGRTVGVTANSHNVIGNLVRAVLDARTDGDVVRVAQRGDEDRIVDHPAVTHAKDNPAARKALDDGQAGLVAGTGWLWSSPEMVDAVDVLFVDEAGQMSLANVIAMGRAAKSIVLLGDPQQLDQPTQGSHPTGADRSALAHLLDEDATIPASQGLFLETTWRLHPDLTRFTSEVFYDDRLVSEAHLSTQRVRADAGLDGTGPRLIEVVTSGADNESPVEAAQVAALARAIVEGGGRWTNAEGVEAPMTWDDVLIVAPYNAQVAAIERLLPDRARVGTVDKFQGQEAPISLYSLTTSSPELAPRGMPFLYSSHRLNVATSRARCVAVVVGSPDLWRVRARTPDQMRLANAFCRFVELATVSRAGSDGSGRSDRPSR